MFATQEFEDNIDLFTLRFYKKNQEKHYRKFNDSTNSNKILQRIIFPSVLFMTIAISMKAINHIKAGDYYLAFSAIISILSGAIGVAAELLAMKSSFFKKYRGLFINTGVYFCCSFYATRVLSEPSFHPGYFFSLSSLELFHSLCLHSLW